MNYTMALYDMSNVELARFPVASIKHARDCWCVIAAEMGSDIYWAFAVYFENRPVYVGDYTTDEC